MIRTLTAASVLALGLAGVASAETRTYDVSSFTQIDISAGLDLNFEQGAAQSISVENDKGDFSDIEVLVKGDTLVLKRKKNMNWGWNNRRQRYGITVTAPVISGVEASSAQTSQVAACPATGSPSTCRPAQMSPSQALMAAPSRSKPPAGPTHLSLAPVTRFEPTPHPGLTSMHVTSFAKTVRPMPQADQTSPSTSRAA